MASEIQQDSKPILQDGTGTPYLAIFDGSGNAIIDPLSNLPIGVFCTSNILMMKIKRILGILY